MSQEEKTINKIENLFLKLDKKFYETDQLKTRIQVLFSEIEAGLKAVEAKR